jgi:hypothetical protein
VVSDAPVGRHIARFNNALRLTAVGQAGICFLLPADKRVISMKKRISALVLAMSGLATAAWADVPSQFDIACKGNVTTTNKSGTRSNAETDLYHIDLINHQWCNDRCTIVKTIVSVQPDLLVIQKMNVSMSSGSTSFSMNGSTSFNRKSNILVMDMAMGELVIKGEIPCAIKPFTPFPENVNYN